MFYIVDDSLMSDSDRNEAFELNGCSAGFKNFLSLNTFI